MAIQTTASWNLDADEILDAAFNRAGGQPAKGYELRLGRRALNLVFQKLIQRGTNLWQLERIQAALTVGEPTFSFAADTINVFDLMLQDPTQTTANEQPVEIVARDEWSALPDKTMREQPRIAYLHRDRDAPLIHMWPVPDKAYVMSYWRLRAPRDVLTMVDNVDAPARWLPAIIAGTAYYVALERPKVVGADRLLLLKETWEDEFADAEAEDVDGSGSQVVSDIGAYYR